MKVFIILILSWSVFATAAERIGQIDCYTLDRPVSYVVRADLFGTRAGTDWKIEYANIELAYYNWDSNNEKSQPVAAWQQVPSMNDRNFSEHFKNKDVELDAFYDDVGAMSSINFVGKEHQLACDVALE